jgi:hypothetical protein
MQPATISPTNNEHDLLGELRREFVLRLESQDREHKAYIAKLEQEHNARFTNLEQEHNARINKLEQEHNARITNLEQEHNARITNLEQEYNARINVLQVENQNLRSRMANIEQRQQEIDIHRRHLREEKKKHANAAKTSKELVTLKILRFLF